MTLLFQQIMIRQPQFPLHQIANVFPMFLPLRRVNDLMYSLHSPLINHTSHHIYCAPTSYIRMQFYVFQDQGINSTILSLRKITNEEVHVKSYDSNDIVPCSLQKISQNYLNSLSPLDVPIYEDSNIIYNW